MLSIVYKIVDHCHILVDISFIIILKKPFWEVFILSCALILELIVICEFCRTNWDVSESHKKKINIGNLWKKCIGWQSTQFVPKFLKKTEFSSISTTFYHFFKGCIEINFNIIPVIYLNYTDSLRMLPDWKFPNISPYRVILLFTLTESNKFYLYSTIFEHFNV